MDHTYTKQTLHYYWHEVRKHKRLFIPLVFILPAALFFNNYASAWIISQVVNRLVKHPVASSAVWHTFGPWAIAYIGSVILGELVFWRLVLFLVWKLETRVTYALNRSSFEALATQSMDFHNNRFGGSLVSQVNKFSGAYVRLMDVFMFNVLPLLCSFLFTFTILGPQMPAFALGLAGLAMIFMLIATLSFRSVRELNVMEAETQNKLSGQLADSITNIMAIKSYSSESYEKQRYDELNKQARQASNNVMSAIMRRDISFGSVIVVMSSFSFLFLIGGHTWFNIQIGTLILAITYTGQVLGQLWNFNNILRGSNRSFGDAQEMTKILGEAKSVVDVHDAPDLNLKRARISFENVTFKHKDAGDEPPLFKDFNLDIQPGEQVGLVGQSGSGKTTLTKLLLRFVDIDSGVIRIDGHNIADVTQESLRRNIAYVPQEPMLFHRSLRDNIAYGRPGATDKEVVRAAKQANALEFIEKLPEGFNTTVGERGVKLSGGQRQRIAIARAILKNAPILVLDEATSALDSESERLIQDALVQLMKGRTAIVIAHRLSTIQKMDTIVVLDHGRIIESGSHKQLLKQKGVYASLWSHQSGGFMEGDGE